MIQIFQTLIQIYGAILFIRALVDWTGPYRYNPTARALYLVTDPVLGIFKSTGKLHALLPGILALALLYLIKYLVLTSGAMLQFGELSYIWVVWFSEIWQLMFQTLFWMVLAYVVLSWIGYPNHPAVEILVKITSQLLAPIRRIVPTFGAIDLSPIVLIIGLQLLGNIMTQLLVQLIS